MPAITTKFISCGIPWKGKVKFPNSTHTFSDEECQVSCTEFDIVSDGAINGYYDSDVLTYVEGTDGLDGTKICKTVHLDNYKNYDEVVNCWDTFPDNADQNKIYVIL